MVPLLDVQMGLRVLSDRDLMVVQLQSQPPHKLRGGFVALQRLSLPFLLALALSATPVMAQPMSKIVDTHGHSVLAYDDFNLDGRPEFITEELFSSQLVLCVRDAQTGIRWMRTFTNLPANGAVSFHYWDLDQDGRPELFVQDGIGVHCFKVPNLPAVPPAPDAVLRPQ